MSKIFKPRLNGNGWTKTKWFTKEYNNFVKNGISVPNCTVHVAARWAELFNHNAKEELWGDYDHILGNAKYWYADKSIGVNKDLKRGSTPKLGAIVCFDGNYGHVCVVEKIEGNKVTCSYQEKDGTSFSLATENWKVGTSYGKYGWGKFQGYIYPPVEFVLEEKPATALKFKVGDKVIVNGNLYISSYAVSPNGKVTNKVTEITRIANGAKHPYNTTGDLGWMDEKDIKLYTEKPIKVGDTVRVTKAINYDNGKEFALYYDKYKVMELNRSRAVIGVDGTVTSAIDVKNLKKV